MGTPLGSRPRRLPRTFVLVLMVIAMITGTMSPASAAVTVQNLDVPLTGTFSIAGSGTFTLSGTAHLVITQQPADPVRPAVTRIQTNLVNAVANNGPPIRPVTGAASADLAPASTQIFTLTYQFRPQNPVQPVDPVRPVSIRYHLDFDSTGTVTEYTASAAGTF